MPEPGNGEFLFPVGPQHGLSVTVWCSDGFHPPGVRSIFGHCTVARNDPTLAGGTQCLSECAVSRNALFA